MSTSASKAYRDAWRTWVRRVDAAHGTRDGNPSTLVDAFRAGWDARDALPPKSVKEAMDAMTTEQSKCFSLFSGIFASVTTVCSVEDIQLCISVFAQHPYLITALLDVSHGAAKRNRRDFDQLLASHDAEGKTGEPS